MSANLFKTIIDAFQECNELPEKAKAILKTAVRLFSVYLNYMCTCLIKIKCF